MAEPFDVVVVGAGPAGAATATLLAARGCRVALLHAASRTSGPLGESLTGGAAALLAGLGVWERFRAGPHRPVYSRASAWGRDELLEQSAVFDPHGPSWLIERDAFDALLRERAREVGARLLTARVTGCSATRRGGWRLELADGAELGGRAVVDATGRQCWVTRAVGGHREVHDRMAALAARLVPAAASTQRPPVLVEATPSGWWYSALIPSGAIVALFVTETTIATPDESASAWAQALAAAPHTRARLDGASGVQPPEVLPVTVQRAVVPPTTTACVAVGDAALGLDPLSAAGLRTSLESATEAADALTAALDGDRFATTAYAAWASVVLDAHLAERRYYYDLVARWPAAAFWVARRSPRAASPRPGSDAWPTDRVPGLGVGAAPLPGQSPAA